MRVTILLFLIDILPFDYMINLLILLISLNLCNAFARSTPISYVILAK